MFSPPDFLDPHHKPWMSYKSVLQGWQFLPKDWQRKKPFNSLGDVWISSRKACVEMTAASLKGDRLPVVPKSNRQNSALTLGAEPRTASHSLSRVSCCWVSGRFAPTAVRLPPCRGSTGRPKRTNLRWKSDAAFTVSGTSRTSSIRLLFDNFLAQLIQPRGVVGTPPAGHC
jgi:hypothetical protein